MGLVADRARACRRSALRAAVTEQLSRLARLCWALDAHRRMLAILNIAAAALFVVGCIGFFWPSLYLGSVTLFLVGSVLFLAAAAGSALVEHGPCT